MARMKNEAALNREIDKRVQSGEDYITARKETRRKNLEAFSRDTYDNFPDEKQLPDEGGWIQVIMPPHCEITCEPLSIWYAMPAFVGRTWDFMEGELSNRYKIKVLTPIGEFMLFPMEYRIVDPGSINEYMNQVGGTSDEDKEHVVLHWLDPRNEFFDVDRLFYLMSRGVSRGDAYKMLMGEVKSQHVCYFTFHVEYQKMFAGVGVPHLSARQNVESHIDFVLREKAAGRWYNPEYAAQQKAANAEAERLSKEEGDLRKKKSKTRNDSLKRFDSMLANIRL
jgi:hypothetical protein